MVWCDVVLGWVGGSGLVVWGWVGLGVEWGVMLRCVALWHRVVWFGLVWFGLGWVGLGWVGLGWLVLSRGGVGEMVWVVTVTVWGWVLEWGCIRVRCGKVRCVCGRSVVWCACVCVCVCLSVRVETRRR